MSKCKRNPIFGGLVARAARCALLAMLAAAPLAARAEAARADPIDTAMQSCSARADRSSTPGQVQCIDAARNEWKVAIDAAMRSIAVNAPDEEKRGWANSQNRWVAWRKEEAALLHAVFETARGSTYSITEANVRLQSVRDRALAVRHTASRFAPPPPVPLPAASGASGASGALSSSSASGAGAGAGVGLDAQSASSFAVSRAQNEDARAHGERMRPCNVDAACEHAQFDLRRYERTLRERLPVHARSTLTRAQRAWSAYFDATAPLGTEAERADLIGERVATIKRLSEAVGND
jgi:uncharacterized protein YecT (DUF1311 family)